MTWHGLGKEPVTTNGFELQIPEDSKTENYIPFAFHRDVARFIKERDNHTCLCGNSREQGYKLHASHKDHKKTNPYYNHPDNGTTLCVECHLREHIYLLQEADDDDLNWAWHSVRLLAQGVWDDSFHTKGYQHRYGSTLEDDRGHLEQVFFSYDMDVFEFITVKDL